MEQSDLQKHIYRTYFFLRWGLALLAFFFPFLLVGIGWLWDISLQESMSHYYFAIAPADPLLREFPMRPWFVGILWALGSFLILYKGFSWQEDWLLNFAGLCALGVAFFPMSTKQISCDHCVSEATQAWADFHYWCAVALFLLMAIVAWFCTKETLKYLKEKKPTQVPTFEKLYTGIAIFMFVLPLLAYLVTRFLEWKWQLFAVEAAGIIVFAIYWMVKTCELYLSGAEEMAALGLNPNEAQKIEAMGLQAEKMAVMGLELAKVIEDNKEELADLANSKAPKGQMLIAATSHPQTEKIKEMGAKLLEIVKANKKKAANEEAPMGQMSTKDERPDSGR